MPRAASLKENSVMSAKKTHTLVYVAAFALLLGGLGYLMASGLSQSSVYFLNVSEALAMDAKELAAARLFGTVDAAGLTRLPDEPGVRFRLLDKEDVGQALVVEYKGAVPDTFKPGAEVIVEGGFPPDSDVFWASVLMTKCPSKYQKENRKG
jgi:cytochrome c-type biogenesis protein CcmE